MAQVRVERAFHGVRITVDVLVTRDPTWAELADALLSLYRVLYDRPNVGEPAERVDGHFQVEAGVGHYDVAPIAASDAWIR